MTKRRMIATVLILAAAAVAAVLLFKTLGPGPAEESEETTTIVDVHVAKIVRVTLRDYVTAYGAVEPEPAAEGRSAAGALISSPVGGLLAEILCTEGRPVARGTVLFRLDARVAEVAVQKAQKELEFAERVFERQKNLLAADGTSSKSYQEAEQALSAARNGLAAARAERSLFEIAAPVAGTLVRLNARPGQSVEPNTVLGEIIDLDRLVVSVQVPSREGALIKPGQAVDFGTEITGAGMVTFVGKDIDPQTDTILVRTSIPAGAAVQPGRFLSVRIVREERRDRLAVPLESLVMDEGREAIAIVEGDKAAKRPVKSGLRDGGLVEVEGDGVTEGLTVVVEGAYGLPKESRIRVIGR